MGNLEGAEIGSKPLSGGSGAAAGVPLRGGWEGKNKPIRRGAKFMPPQLLWGPAAMRKGPVHDRAPTGHKRKNPRSKSGTGIGFWIG